MIKASFAKATAAREKRTMCKVYAILGWEASWEKKF
jgi:hypothetical protein